MSQPINNLLMRWMDHKMTKRANWLSSVASKAGPFFSDVAKNTPKALKMGAGAGVTLGALEAATRTGNNFIHGRPDVGTPDWTGKQVGHVVNFLSNHTIRPVIQNAAQGLELGLDKNKTVQQILDSTSNLTNPQVRSKVIDEFINNASAKAVDISKNVGNMAGNAFGHSLGSSLMDSVTSDVIKHPFMTFGGAAVLGAGPAMTYDALTYKRRKAEAERNKLIMRYVLRNEKQANFYKQAGISSFIKEYAMKDNLQAFSKKFLNNEPNIASSRLEELLKNHLKDGTVPLKDINNSGHYPQTLFNNSLTRHPVRGLVAPYAGLGLAASAAQMAKSQMSDRVTPYDNNFDTFPHTAETLTKNMMAGPYSLFKAYDLAAVKNMDIGNSSIAKKINQIKDNLTSHQSKVSGSNTTTPANQGSGIRQMVDQLTSSSSPQLDSANHHSSIGKYLPYASVAALMATPAASYGLYRRYANKKLNRLDNDNQKLLQLTEQANQDAGK